MPLPIYIAVAVSVLYLVVQAIRSKRTDSPSATGGKPEEAKKSGLSPFLLVWVLVLTGIVVWRVYFYKEVKPATAEIPMSERVYTYQSEEAPDVGREYNDPDQARARMIGEDDESWSFVLYGKDRDRVGKKMVTKTCSVTIMKPNKERLDGRWEMTNPKGGGYAKLKKVQTITNGFCLELGNDADPGLRRDVYLFPVPVPE